MMCGNVGKRMEDERVYMFRAIDGMEEGKD